VPSVPTGPCLPKGGQGKREAKDVNPNKSIKIFLLKIKQLKYFCVKSLSKLFTAGLLKIKIVTFVLSSSYGFPPCQRQGIIP
jgi:hypothetical protein